MSNFIGRHKELCAHISRRSIRIIIIPIQDRTIVCREADVQARHVEHFPRHDVVTSRVAIRRSITPRVTFVCSSSVKSARCCAGGRRVVRRLARPRKTRRACTHEHHRVAFPAATYGSHLRRITPDSRLSRSGEYRLHANIAGPQPFRLIKRHLSEWKASGH